MKIVTASAGLGYGVEIDPRPATAALGTSARHFAAGPRPAPERRARDVEKDHPVTAICPPTKGSADTDATFSCLADGYWMMVTSFMGLLWVGAAYCVLRRSRRAEEDGGGSTELV